MGSCRQCQRRRGCGLDPGGCGAQLCARGYARSCRRPARIRRVRRFFERLCRRGRSGKSAIRRKSRTARYVSGSRTNSSPFTGKYGYITPDGKPAIPAQSSTRGRENSAMTVLLPSAVMQGKYYVKSGFADRAGRIAIPATDYSVNAFERRARRGAGRFVAGGKLAYGCVRSRTAGR